MKITQNFRRILTGLSRLIAGIYRRVFGRTRLAELPNHELERLQQLNKSKDQLLAIISHDLRSAVHSLQINMTHLKTLLAQGDLKGAMSLTENTGEIILSTQSLLNNLLYWSLGQTGQLSFQPERLNLRPVIDQVCYDFLPIASSRGIALYYNIAVDFFCTADVNSVKLILRNLIDNAIKYTPPNGAVTIAARQENDHCHITIQDTGIGMDREIINALFSGDTRRIQRDTSGRQSTGIGLWLAKNMAERNGGSLRISSDINMGTTVRVALPIYI